MMTECKKKHKNKSFVEKENKTKKQHTPTHTTPVFIVFAEQTNRQKKCDNKIGVMLQKQKI